MISSLPNDRELSHCCGGLMAILGGDVAGAVTFHGDRGWMLRKDPVTSNVKVGVTHCLAVGMSTYSRTGPGRTWRLNWSSS